MAAIDSWFEEHFEADTYQIVAVIDTYTDFHGTYYISFLNCDQDQINEIAAAFEQWVKGQELNSKLLFYFRGYNEEDFNRIELMTIMDIVKSRVELSYSAFLLRENGETTPIDRDE